MAIAYVGQHGPFTSHTLPIYLSTVSAGFPSPADDYLDQQLDLNEYLIKKPAATFYCRVSGASMQEVGIFDGDLLIVDRSITPRHGHIVIAVLDGEMTCKQLDLKKGCLLAANRQYPSISIGSEVELVIEGVVIHSIRSHVCAR
ncbi:MAG: translesion error-prone DNA polymerase V autoproteolytic subunit [Gammaproteobacteria bacterium]